MMDFNFFNINIINTIDFGKFQKFYLYVRMTLLLSIIVQFSVNYMN